ncbi:MAG: hypothetical protein LQ349_006310 [Xanthoria aureola]|nr:MAG: hypothetical protein LQ349_006310 [Xanthoria aureola]
MKTSTLLVRLSSNISKPISRTTHPSTPFRIIPPSTHLSSTTPTRPFTSALTPLQTLTASRILPYRQRDLYNIVADIPSYPSFLPYCKSSRITSHSHPDPTHSQNWPHTATLNVGWGPYDETFKSRIYCLPHHTLEACAGSASPTIAKSKLPHYQNLAAAEEDGEENNLFTSLLTRWTLSEFPFKPLPPDRQSPQEGDAEANPAHPRTEVSLVIEARFNSAMYSALSQAAAPKVAGMMIAAFEKRARSVLGEGHGVEDDGRGSENRGRETSTEGIVGDEGAKSWNTHH